MPRQRLRWHVLKCFGALPTEERAKAMREEDYLWCAVNLLLDEEEVAPSAVPSVPGGGGEGPVPGVRPGDGRDGPGGESHL